MFLYSQLINHTYSTHFEYAISLSQFTYEINEMNLSKASSNKSKVPSFSWRTGILEINWHMVGPNIPIPLLPEILPLWSLEL